MGLEAKVIVSLSHEENPIPMEFMENLKPSIEVLFSQSKLTPEILGKGSCVLIYNPKQPFLDEEIKCLKKYRNEVGIFLITDYKNPEEYEILKKSNFVEELFDAELILTQFIPTIKLGSYHLIYRKDGLFGKDKKKVVKEIELPCYNFSRKIKFIPAFNLPFSLPEKIEISEDDRKFISFFKHARERSFLYRITEYTQEKESDIAKIEEELMNKYKRDGEYYLVGGVDFLDLAINLFSSDVGILSSEGYGVALATDKIFEEISRQSEISNICQNFIEKILIWLSQASVYKFPSPKRVVEEKQVVIETKPQEKIPQIPEKEAVIQQVDKIILESLVKTYKLGVLLERGNVEETLQAMKDLASFLVQHGDEENGSIISYFYNKFDQKFSSQNYQIAENTKMNEVLKFLPDLIKEKEELQKLIRRIASYYEKMRQI